MSCTQQEHSYYWTESWLIDRMLINVLQLIFPSLSERDNIDENWINEPSYVLARHAVLDFKYALLQGNRISDRHVSLYEHIILTIIAYSLMLHVIWRSSWPGINTKWDKSYVNEIKFGNFWYSTNIWIRLWQLIYPVCNS